MTVTADHNMARPTSPPLPPAFLSNPDLTKLYSYSHKSCPELVAESVVSSDDSSVGSGFMGNELNNSVNEPRFTMFEPLETHDEERRKDRVFSMDCEEEEEDNDSEEVDEEDREFLPLTRGEPVMTLGDIEEDMGEFPKPLSSSAPSRIEVPSVIISSPPRSLPSLSDPSSSQVIPNNINDRRKLQWQFKGLTLWLELEEFDNDLTQAVEDFSSKHYSPWIPKPHTTAIYGMEHLSHEEASRRLRKVREIMPNGKSWPSFAKPTGVTSDIAVCGRPGQVCSIAWSELTLASNDEHEQALDALYSLFYSEENGEDVEERHRPWKPHNSIAYDNPETNTLSLLDTITYMSLHPTLLGCERRVEAISLWSTVGKMEEWTCIDRVKFF